MNSRVLLHRVTLSSFAVYLCLLGPEAWGQQQLGAIQGTITDPTEAVLVGATVRVTNQETGEQRTTATNDSGVYRVVSLAPGRYDVSVEMQGFGTAVRRNVLLPVGGSVRLDIQLQPGTLQEIVDVVASVADLQAERAVITAVVEEKKVSDLPLQFRNVFQLAALQPGITGLASGADFLVAEYGHGLNASGLRASAHHATLDGATISGVPWGGTVLIIPNPESVEEFQVVANNPSAEYGRNAGMITSVVTKSGTNELHGSIFWYHRNDNLRARNVFEAVVPEFRRHDFGYSLGGPIRKDKTFFFTTYEGIRQLTGRGALAVVETRAFADLVQRTRPNSIAARLMRDYPPQAYPTEDLRDLGSPVDDPFRIDPPDGIADVGTITGVSRGERNGGQANARMDQTLFGGSGKLRGTYYGMEVSELGGHIRPKFRQPYWHRNQFFNLAYTHIISPRTVNEFSFGYLRMRGDFPDKNPESPTISIGGGVTGFGTLFWIPIDFAQNNFEYKNVLATQLGNHGLKLGVELRRAQDNANLHHWLRPNYSFNSILNFAMDRPFSETRAVDPATGLPTNASAGYRTFEWGAFIQNDWKARRNLTLNLGLRYENFGNPKEVNNRLQGLILGSGANIFERFATARMARVNQLYSTDNNNFGPRLGLAWLPTRSGAWVIRAGGGVSYNRINNTVFSDERLNPPRFGAATTDVRTAGAPPIVYTMGPNYPPNPALARGVDERGGIRGARLDLRVVNSRLRIPYVLHWFFGVQRQLPGAFVAEANYIATAGRKLLTGDAPGGENYNRFAGDLLDGRLDRFNPSFGVIGYADGIVNSAFHGFTFQAIRRYGRGFAFQAALTLGKTLDTPTVAMEVTRRDLDRGLASFDVNRKLSLNAIWEVPFWKETPGWKHILGGWQLNLITQLQSGLPFSVFHGGAYPTGDFNADGTNNDRPHTPTFGNTRTGLKRSDYLVGVLSAADFPRPAAGTLGNLARNTFRGPGYASTDLSVFKNFRAPWYRESATVQFRAEFYNLFNRVNLGSPTGNLHSVLFGRSTSAFDGRDIQFALKFMF